MRVYLDNVAASGRVLGDLAPVVEMEALRKIEEAHRTGVIKRMTSRESWREQERSKDPAKRTKLEAARCEVSVVGTDHIILGSHTVMGTHGTTVVGPLVTDIVDDALFADLRALGLKPADARHLMYAASNACVRFVTLDPDFLDRRSALEARCKPLHIVKPSELAAELRAFPEGHDAS
jgi:predicted nucleic acid-binding protein